MSVLLRPRSTTIVIYQGDDMDRLADLNRKVTVAERIAEQSEGVARRLGDVDISDSAVVAAKAEYDRAIDECAERALTVELQSIGRKRFRDLLLAHPPRRVQSEPDEAGKTTEVDHPEDINWGFNTETFPSALLAFREGGSSTIAQPAFESSADVQRFIDFELADGDFEQLWVGAVLLNRSPSQDPSMRRYSTGSPSTDAT